MAIRVDPEWWKTLFDKVYLLTDARTVCDDDLTRREVDVICELAELHPEHRILDLCGGHGRHSLELCARGFSKCTVLDFSRPLLEHGRAIAAERGCRIEFVQGDARQTGLPAHGFDHVLILGNSLGYLPDPDDDRRILLEAFRLLRPGGRILLDLPNGDAVKKELNPRAWHEIDGGTVVCRERELLGDTVHARELVLSKREGLIRDCSYAIRIYQPGRLAELLSGVGFDRVSVRQGFSPQRKRGDYGFMNRRVLITAQRPRL